MFRIAKEFHFSASHQLTHLPPEHPCARLHGHNYVVEVEVEGQSVNAVGFIVDYREMDAIKRYIDDTLDHKHLNDIFGGSHGVTAERMAESLYWTFIKLLPATVSAVRVRETPKTVAEFRP